MIKRLICVTLAAVMLLGVFAVGPFQARAESNMTISPEGEAMIKAFEGINWQPKWDNKQASVGYGCSVTDERWAITDPTDPLYVDKQKDENGNFIKEYNDYKGGLDYVISLEGAQKLLDEHMTKHATAVNNFANKHGLTFTQGQFDALVSLSFNIGGSWMSKTDWHIYKAVTSGDMGAYLAYAFTLYSTSGGVTTQGHVRRRLLELDMYLYGKYDTDKNWPEDVRYVLLDANGGESQYNPHGFNVNHPTTDFWTYLTAPTGTDASGNPFTYEFAGWYTEPVGGEQIMVLDKSMENGMILYAHWKNPTTGQIDDLQPGTVVDVKVKVKSNVTMREGPCSYYTSVRTVYKNELLHITRVTTGKDGKQWGLTAEGWVRLDYTNYGTTSGDSSSGSTNTGVLKNPISGTVTGDNVNIRSGPGTNYGKTGVQKDAGDQVQIVEIRNGEDGQSSRQWGRMSEGNWICMNYVTLSATPEFVEGEQEPVNPEAPDVSGAITVSSVEIKALPTKREYALGGSERIMDLTGGRIKVTLSNGSSKWIDMTRGMISGFDNTVVGTNTITVTVGGKSDTFTVEIVPVNIAEISMANYPSKVQYIKDQEQLDLTGVTITVHYSPVGTESVPVTADMVTGFDNTVAGTQTITVTYKGFTTSFFVEIVSNDVEGIFMQNLPQKLTYLKGVEQLDLTGVTISVRYGYTGTETVNVTADMVAGFDNTVAGTQTVTVTYKGFTTSFEVEIVSNDVEGISMQTLPQKLTYLIGVEQLDLTGATITVRYGYAGTETVNVTADMITGFDNTVAGVQTVTVTYEGFTTSFEVEVVSNDIEDVSMQTLPQKLTYIMGLDQLDLTGVTIAVRYGYTGTETVIVTADMVTGFDNTVAGTQTVTVTYEGFTTSFDVEVIMLTVVFQNYDGTVISSTQYGYGATVTAPANPTRPAGEHGPYEFVGWDKEITTCTGNVIYTAVYKQVYPVGDVDQNMVVNENDAIYLLRHVVFPEKYPIEVLGDYDKDGDVDENDAIYLLRHVVFPEKYPLS